MIKDFDGWNEKKKGIHHGGVNKLYHEREVWWCTLGVNVGFEQDGSGEEHRRPALILKGLSRETCLAVPLTTAESAHPLRPPVGVVSGKAAGALLSQIRVIDTKRLVRKIGYLDKDFFENIRKAVRGLL
jgi:mRNA-degrading endonuclease toxin of MazEF toxin-antitoxin module